MIPDWLRNFGSWLTEGALAIKPEWSRYLVDIRLGFKRNGKWTSYCQWPPWNLEPVTQNFWNGILTFNIYIVKTILWGKIPFLFPRYDVVIRPFKNWWFESGFGYLFDKGFLAFKFVVMKWPDSTADAQEWNEGSV
jgi:hypothetical protein